jgi:hypothetical protein
MKENAKHWEWLAGAVLLGFIGGVTASKISATVQSGLPIVHAEGGDRNGVEETASSKQETGFVAAEATPSAAESAVDLLQNALAIEDILERRHGLEQLGLGWAKTNVDDAILALNGVRGDNDRQALVRGIFHFLSAQDPKIAMEKVLLLRDGDRLAARKELLAAWASDRSGESPRNAWMLTQFGSGGLGLQLLLTSHSQAELAVLWAKGLEAREGKAQMLAEIAAGVLVRKSPGEAFKLGDELEGEDYLRFARRLSDEWGRTDGKAALDWSLQIADSTLRENLQRSINSAWAASDLEGAKAHLETLPPGPTRDSLISAIASKLAADDTSAAFTWLQELAASDDQILAKRIVQSVAPVGIGTQLSMEEGLPVITSLVSGASAELSQQAQPGDRIVGVDTNCGGDFISTQGMNLEEVGNLIRGQQGTSVRLQISKTNGHGFDPPRVVVLPRSQVINAPIK